MQSRNRYGKAQIQRQHGKTGTKSEGNAEKIKSKRPFVIACLPSRIRVRKPTVLVAFKAETLANDTNEISLRCKQDIFRYKRDISNEAETTCRQKYRSEERTRLTEAKRYLSGQKTSRKPARPCGLLFFFLCWHMPFCGSDRRILPSLNIAFGDVSVCRCSVFTILSFYGSDHRVSPSHLRSLSAMSPSAFSVFSALRSLSTMRSASPSVFLLPSAICK